ncbi:MAG: hypothetical protein JNM40_03095 [Myxococcales bacterium]|nr:hypothetical protein [Myxococcales bacterium]
MWRTKLWLLSLSLGLSALLFGAVVLLGEPSSLSSQAQAQTDALVAKTQQVAALSLQLAAEQLIEQATLVASDAQLVTGLDERARGLAEPELLRQSLAKRIQKLLGAGTDGQAQWAMLVDQEGVVVTRVGLLPSRQGDSLIGWPLLQLGLRGYRLDDLYEEDGRVFEVAVAPLPTLSHEHYAGAVVVGRALDSQLGARLGMTTVWRRNGRVLDADAPTVPSGASLIAVARPGSVAGVELIGWLHAQPAGSQPLSVLRRIRSAVTLPGLLVGLLGCVLLSGIGLALLSWEQARTRSISSISAGFGPFLAHLPDIPPDLPEKLVTARETADFPAKADAVDEMAASQSRAVTTGSGDPSGTDEPIEAALVHMYADFVLAKVRCGESLSGLSFETFCDEIQGSRASITREQGCRDVAFRVLVKDGHATLRATPLW